MQLVSLPIDLLGRIMLLIYTWSLLWKYWNGNSNYFVIVIKLTHLDLRSKYQKTVKLWIKILAFIFWYLQLYVLKTWNNLESGHPICRWTVLEQIDMLASYWYHQTIAVFFCNTASSNGCLFRRIFSLQSPVRRWNACLIWLKSDVVH